MILCLLSTTFLIGCVPTNGSDSENSKTYNEPNRQTRKDTVHCWGVTEIDGCEYIIYSSSQRGGIIHKANCKNVNHNYK